jgi:ligand-binding SRPBCC domain-containing protein
MIHQTRFEQWVRADSEQVFRFFANPENLPRIMPPGTGTALLGLKLVPPPRLPGKADACDPVAGVGSEIVTSFRLVPHLPLRAEWIALITEFEWNHHFDDVQKKGPFKSFRHRHELMAEARNGVNGTVIRDVIEYDVGFGWIGDLAQRLFIHRQLQNTFAYRQRAIEKLLG